MGITGLLPYLSNATRQCHVSEFRGGTLAVDSYCLLHKGAISCFEQLSRGEDNQLYVDYCLKYVKMLLSYDIHPIMVFDGRNLPAKATTESKRRSARKNAKQKAVELLKLGRTDEARTFLKQAIDITPRMAYNLIRECRKLSTNIDCIVAPYESDAQLAFFAIKGVAQCVITEDSDLILFGCSQVLYKLDLTGAGRLVQAEKIPQTMKIRPDQYSFEKFRYMCILSGCDYVNSLTGIGLKKAEKFFRLTVEVNPEVFLDRIPRYLNMKHLTVTDEYKKEVLIANATFLHQTVFDPYQKKLVHLNDPDLFGTNPEYLCNAGDKFDNDKAFEIALGNLNPYNYEEFDNWSPSNVSQYSIWSGVLKIRLTRKEETEILKNKLQQFVQKKETNQSFERELEIAEEEDQIAKDLSRYTNLKVVTNSVTSDKECKTEEITKSNKDKIINLSTNPFLVKRLSQFPRTIIDDNTPKIRSRFFCLSRPIKKNRIENSHNSYCATNNKIGKESIESRFSCLNNAEKECEVDGDISCCDVDDAEDEKNKDNVKFRKTKDDDDCTSLVQTEFARSNRSENEQEIGVDENFCTGKSAGKENDDKAKHSENEIDFSTNLHSRLFCTNRSDREIEVEKVHSADVNELGKENEEIFGAVNAKLRENKLEAILSTKYVANDENIITINDDSNDCFNNGKIQSHIKNSPKPPLPKKRKITSTKQKDRRQITLHNFFPIMLKKA